MTRFGRERSLLAKPFLPVRSGLRHTGGCQDDGPACCSTYPAMRPSAHPAGVPYSYTSALHSRPNSPPDKAQGSQGCKAGDAGCKARRGQEARCKAEQEKVGPSVSGHPHCQYVSPRTPSQIFQGFSSKAVWKGQDGQGVGAVDFPRAQLSDCTGRGGSKRIGSIASLK